MRALIVIMLIVQAGIFVATAWTVLVAPSSGGRARPVWSSLAISLIVVAGASSRIADGHEGDVAAAILAYGSPLLLGMGLMAALLAIRQRRGLDAES
jgi:hypothetical protein